jgi:hypothetical protein
LALGIAAFVTAACGDDEGKDTITVDRFPAAYAQALCGSLQHCCDENVVTENFATCTAGWKSYVERLLGTPAARTNYEPRTAKACVDQVRSAANVSCQPVAGSISDARDTCLRIFIGKTPLGSPCTTAAECAPSPTGGRVACEAPPELNDAGVLPLHLEPLAIATPVCVVSAAAPVTAACLVDAASVRSNCDEGLYCEPKTTTCLPLGNVGEACIAGSCAPGGVCAAAGANQGKCVPTSPLGGPCATAAECDATSRCDTGAQKCVAKKLAGESCAEDAECNVGTCDLGTRRCLKNTIATTNTCNGAAQ